MYGGARSSGVDQAMRFRSCVAIAPLAECCASRPKLNHAGPSTRRRRNDRPRPRLPPPPPPPPQLASSATTATAVDQGEAMTATFGAKEADARRREDMGDGDEWQCRSMLPHRDRRTRSVAPRAPRGATAATPLRAMASAYSACKMRPLLHFDLAGGHHADDHDPPRHQGLEGAGLGLVLRRRLALRDRPRLAAGARSRPRVHGDGLRVLPVAAFALAKFVRDNEVAAGRHAALAPRRLGRLLPGDGAHRLGPRPDGDQPGVSRLPRRQLAVPDLDLLHPRQDAARCAREPARRNRAGARRRCAPRASAAELACIRTLTSKDFS